jgi:hypothetical protein
MVGHKSWLRGSPKGRSKYYLLPNDVKTSAYICTAHVEIVKMILIKLIGNFYIHLGT